MSKYVHLATEIGQLVDKKQAAYGDSFSQSQQILKVLYPHGITPTDMQWALTITRIVDKLFRIATNNDVFQEDPWQDICGYALLAAQRCREIKQSEQAELAEELFAAKLEEQARYTEYMANFAAQRCGDKQQSEQAELFEEQGHVEQGHVDQEEMPSQRFRLERNDFLKGLEGLARYSVYTADFAADKVGAATVEKG